MITSFVGFSYSPLTVWSVEISSSFLALMLMPFSAASSNHLLRVKIHPHHNSRLHSCFNPSPITRPPRFIIQPTPSASLPTCSSQPDAARQCAPKDAADGRENVLPDDLLLELEVPTYCHAAIATISRACALFSVPDANRPGTPNATILRTCSLRFQPGRSRHSQAPWPW